MRDGESKVLLPSSQPSPKGRRSFLDSSLRRNDAPIIIKVLLTTTMHIKIPFSKITFVTLLLSSLMLASCVKAQQPSLLWEDEPNELSWELFRSSRDCFSDFAGWWKTLPAGRRKDVLKAAENQGMMQQPPQDEKVLWVQAETLQGRDWSIAQNGERTVLRGRTGHNTATAQTIIDIPAEGNYRLWARWWNLPKYHNSFQVKIRPLATAKFTFAWQTTAQADYFDHRFAFAWHKRLHPAPVSYDADKNGFEWEGAPMVHLPKGKVVLQVSGVIHGGPYTRRDLDCFLLTQDPFYVPGETNIPDDSLTQKVLSAGTANDWQLWSIRPAARPLAQVPPVIATLWNDWRDQFIARLAKGEGKTPAEKAMEQQTYFDPHWNLVGTPAQVAQEAAHIKTRPGLFQWIEAESFTIDNGWDIKNDVKASEGKILQASYGDGAAESHTTLNVTKSGNYRLWIRAAQIKNYYNFFEIAIRHHGQTVGKKEFHDLGTKGSYDYDWYPIDVELQSGSYEIALTKNRGKSPYAYRKVDCMVLTDNLEWKPEQLQHPVSSEIPDNIPQLKEAARQGKVAAWLDDGDDQWTGFSMTDWPRHAAQVIGAAPVSIKAQPGAVQSRVLHLTNPTDQPLTFLPIATGPLNWRLVAYQYQPKFGWQPMPLLRRHQITVPPHLTASLWLNFDARDLSPGTQSASLKIGGQQISFKIEISGTDIRHAKAPFVGGWCDPWPTPSGWQTFADIGLNIVHRKVLSKDEMQKYKISLCNVTLGTPKSADDVHRIVAAMQSMGLDYSDWSWEISDEPGAKSYQKWIEAAKIIRQADPKIRIWCNPGEIQSSTVASVTAMSPWIDIFCPYVNHFTNAAGADASYQKLLASTGNLQLIYTTPCSNEKSPGAPLDLLRMADIALQYHRDGWDMFSLRSYYPYAASAWDEVNPPYSAQAISIYPGAWGQTISSRNLEAVRQSIQNWKTKSAS